MAILGRQKCPKRAILLWPSDVQGGGAAADRGSLLPKGRADLRAPKRSAARPQAAAEAPKKSLSSHSTKEGFIH